MSANGVLEFAGKNRKYDVLEIFNTDRGGQYTSEIHTKTTFRQWSKISMDGKDMRLTTFFHRTFVEDSKIRKHIFTSLYRWTESAGT
jgi:hypothetical protein